MHKCTNKEKLLIWLLRDHRFFFNHQSTFIQILDNLSVYVSSCVSCVKQRQTSTLQRYVKSQMQCFTSFICWLCRVRSRKKEKEENVSSGSTYNLWASVSVKKNNQSWGLPFGVKIKHFRGEMVGLGYEVWRCNIAPWTDSHNS